MGDTRIRYGLAYGRQNNFYTGNTDQTTRGYLTGSDGLFKQADTSPDVTNGYLFYTNNSAATTITDFEFQHPSVGNGNLAGLFEGKVIRIFALDTNTTIQNNSRIVLVDSANKTLSANGMMELFYHTSSWYEACRTLQYPSLTPPAFRTIAIGATNEAITLTNSDYIVYLNNTMVSTVIRGISGGYEGQRVYFAKILSTTGSTIKFSQTNSSGTGNLFFASTGDFTLSVPGSTGNLQMVEFVKLGTAWFIPILMS